MIVLLRVRKCIPLEGWSMKILILMSAFILVSNLLLPFDNIEKIVVDKKSHIPSSRDRDTIILSNSHPKVVPNDNNNNNNVRMGMENLKPLIMYSHLRKDQSGWVIMDMLKAHSWAYERNFTYGGACGESQHKKDIQNVLTLSGFDKILPLKCPPKLIIHKDNNNNTRYGQNTTLFTAGMVHDDNNTRHIMYHASIYEKGYQQRLVSPDWKDHVQQHLNYIKDDNDDQPTNHTHPPTIRFVVHIRRRDVTPCCYPDWYIPNTYFEAMIDKYVQIAQRQQQQQEDYPSGSANIQVDIYSQADSFESWTPFEKYNLHLDGEVGLVWKAILNADYFIGSKSQFSHVPAMFSRGTVIEEFYHWPLWKNESQRIFAQCTDTMIFSCRHKWWQNRHQHQHLRKGDKLHPQGTSNV